MHTQRILFALAAASTACATGGSSGAGSAPSPAVQGVLERAATTQPPAPPARPAAPTPPPAPKDINPVGAYGLNLVAQGNAIAVTLRIERRQDGSLGGTVSSEVIPVLPVTGVEVAGNAIKVYVTGPGGESVVLNLIVEGDDVRGDWSMGSDGSQLSGKKLP